MIRKVVHGVVVVLAVFALSGCSDAPESNEFELSVSDIKISETSSSAQLDVDVSAAKSSTLKLK
ncbi:hypothetical protein ACK1CN_18625 [Vibrio coralliilyticus]|uniref:Uncharacterized protein n=1 Tax=Vibrio coralliilyticus TaxID=190893 RepID=A0AAN0SGD1_9VIBR|nr:MULTISPECIES: hypothetical protein [Vibrio]AIS58020.1 hypothetical protein JV59_23965 [Vibrio coralliilyticus]AIW22017.1 hypothetical protein IX92_23900 [Vibrio coralliilyticus]ANW26465.1 hypothetical protein BA953_20115 [Vibrio coralliilyticus]AXN33710.1 hypothetical protein DVV14_20940 [Vibrio coralliilyticus]ERB62918.1 hypothetical protein N779_23680 [Vibrio coralliilyticus OCN008]